ncbi:Ribonuclease H protein [Theobroma cacao]|uniref:Ribonuclease H protein n=1 Tax=Theobroma cacao TaxID=3641 RepID=A0A061DL10_THECC|nr:Ribonuclease H protein [Theobroma cacao]
MLLKFYCMVGLACCSGRVLWTNLLEGHRIRIYICTSIGEARRVSPEPWQTRLDVAAKAQIRLLIADLIKDYRWICILQTVAVTHRGNEILILSLAGSRLAFRKMSVYRGTMAVVTSSRGVPGRDTCPIYFCFCFLLGDKTLVDITYRVPNLALDKNLVRDFLNPHGHWDHDKLFNCLPYDVLMHVLQVMLPTLAISQDEPYGGLSASGQFTIAWTYDYLRQLSSLTDVKLSGIWQGAWKWQGPQRVRTFLFQCLHGRLLTNRERLRRRLTIDSLSPQCKMEDETMTHVLRDCMVATSLWVRIIPHHDYNVFFTLPLRKWLVCNLQKHQLILYENPWFVVFGLVCWHLWKWCNSTVLDATIVPTRSRLCC